MSVLPWAREISEIRFEADDHTFGADALGQLLENVPVALSVTLGRDHRYVFANRLFRNVMKPRSGQLIGRTVFEILGDLYTPEARAIRERVLGTGEPFEASGVPISIVSDAPPRYWDLKLLPVRDGEDQVIGILTLGVEVTGLVEARAEAERRTRESQYHTDRLALAIDATELGLWEWDVRTGQVFWSDRQKEIWGLRPDEAGTYEVWHGTLHPEDRDGVVAGVSGLLDPASGGQLRVEHRILRRDGETRWILSRGRMLYEFLDGELKASRLLGTVLDITERKQAEEDRLLLARELNHRVKNLFAVASGMVALTARSASSPREMGTALRGRLEALARAHDLIQPVIGGNGADRPATVIADLVQAVLAPYHEQGETGRLQVEGPPVTVGSHAATALTLVLHELATNAAKYGALCVPEGRLAITWAVENDRIGLRWVERGGPPVEGAPTSKGFGSQLAQKSIAGQLGGALAHDWQREGLRLTITLPLARLKL